MTYEEVCDKYRGYKGDRSVQAAWGRPVVIDPCLTLDLWLPTTGTFTVEEAANLIYIYWQPE